MTARRSTTPAVTLFPFLAVLVCAMGALIFLLLITTRRIRQQSVERALAVAAVEDEQPLPEPILIALVEPEPVDDPLDNEPILPLLVSDPPPKPPPVPIEPEADLREERLAELREEWRQEVDTLERQQRQLTAALTELESALSEDERRANLQQTALSDTRRELDDAENDVASARQHRQSLLLRQSELEHDIRDNQARLQRVLEDHAQAAGQFEILPYDGLTGTTRRPILIECTEQGFQFLSDGVELTPDDVNGFTPEQNPLLAGTEALLSYWTSRDLNSRGSDSPTGRPYVLLIVRPGGTLAYYIARRLLEPLDEPFGYELVTDQQFVPPESNPQARAALQRAIDYLLSERHRLLARMQGGALPVVESLRFSDGSGRFYLDEVERLRESSNTVHFGGREVERQGTGSGNTGAPPPRVVELPRTSVAGAGQTSGGERVPAQGAPADSERLYDSQIASDDRHGDSVNRLSPPRRRTFDAEGPVGWQSSRDRTSDAGEQTTGPGRDSGAAQPQRMQGQRAPTGSTPPAAEFQTPRGGRRIDVDNPEWGLREPGSSIGLERDVTVRIDASQVHVADEEPLQIAVGISRDELQRDLAVTLDEHIRGWGRPPNSFFWMPSIRFEVAPGGHQYYQRLQKLIDDWKLRSNVEFVLE